MVTENEVFFEPTILSLEIKITTYPLATEGTWAKPLKPKIPGTRPGILTT